MKTGAGKAGRHRAGANTEFAGHTSELPGKTGEHDRLNRSHPNPMLREGKRIQPTQYSRPTSKKAPDVTATTRPRVALVVSR